MSSFKQILPMVLVEKKLVLRGSCGFKNLFNNKRLCDNIFPTGTKAGVDKKYRKASSLLRKL